MRVHDHLGLRLSELVRCYSRRVQRVHSRGKVGRAGIPWSVLCVAVIVLGLKLVVAARTAGTNDILHWTAFANAVRQYGPIRVYGANIPGSYYNHPPLMGYVLGGVDVLRHLGVPVSFTIRAISSLADVATALIVYGLVRSRRGEMEATACGILVACSPVLFTISGFHGNTDPVFTMLTLLSVYLLTDRRRPGWAGVAIGLAIGVKIVAAVAVPTLLVYAAIQGRRFFLRFCVAAAVVLMVTWMPAIALEWSNLRVHVLEYPGLGEAQWGFMQFGHWAGNPWWVAWTRGSGRVFVAALCATVPALAVLRRPRAAPIGVAVALCGFLALSPEFAAQYLAWAAAPLFVISLWGGIAYNASAGLLLVLLYDRWSNGFFATSRAIAYYHPFTAHEVVFLMIPWAVLLLSCWHGLRTIWTTPRERSRSASLSNTSVTANDRVAPESALPL